MKGVVEVEATYGSSSGKNSGKVEYSYALSGGTINVGLALVDVAIPEFSIITTPIVLSLLSFGIASFVRKKKHLSAYNLSYEFYSFFVIVSFLTIFYKLARNKFLFNSF